MGGSGEGMTDFALVIYLSGGLQLVTFADSHGKYFFFQVFSKIPSISEDTWSMQHAGEYTGAQDAISFPEGAHKGRGEKELERIIS